MLGQGWMGPPDLVQGDLPLLHLVVEPPRLLIADISSAY